MTPAVVTGHGANTTEFSFMVAPPRPIFLYAGTYSKLAGASILIDAFAHVVRDNPEYVLQFFGNGTDRDAVAARAAELAVADKVEFHPSMPPGQLREQLAGAVASLASKHPGIGYDYGFSTKVLSSLAVGCPVVFAGPGPTADFIAEAARSVTPGVAVARDAAAIAEAMQSMIQNPPTAEQRRATAEWISEHYSQTAVARRAASVVLSAARYSS
jgi:glycosyltransferase involved in cell wall biosynthesis